MDQPGSSKNMKWMYEGTKSLVNREDYLLGKKIDKNFELYSDVVVKDKEEENKQEFFKRSLIESDHGNTNHKISALDTRIVRNEDPLVALKFQEAQRRQKMLDNPLLKLKAQRVLKKAFEKELKKETVKKHKRKSHSSSSSEEEEEYEERKGRGSGHRRERRRSDENRRSAEIGKRERKRRKSSTRSRSRSRDRRRRDKDERWSERRGNGGQNREKRRTNEREESKQRDERKPQQPSSSSIRRPKLTAEEMEERRKAMMTNANWRDEQREQNMAMAAEKLRKEEADARRIMGPSFIKPLLDSTSANSSLEKRLQSNRMNIQRTHDHMDKSFARK